jgi:hypothetical protein
MRDLYGVFPDGQDGPSAVFLDLADAIAWGLERYGGDCFGIRGCALELEAAVAPPCRPAA